MLLFAGLGNPGAKYADNRHNVGFMAADAIARRHSFSPWTQEVPGPDRRRHDRRREGPADQAADLHEPVRPGGRRGDALLQARRLPTSRSSTTSSTCAAARCASRSAAAPAATTASGRIDQPCRQATTAACASASAIPAVKELVHRPCARRLRQGRPEWLDPLLDAIAEQCRPARRRATTPAS